MHSILNFDRVVRTKKRPSASMNPDNHALECRRSSNRDAQIVGTKGLDHASLANVNTESSHMKQHAHNMSPKFLAGEPVMHCPDEQPWVR